MVISEVLPKVPASAKTTTAEPFFATVVKTVEQFGVIFPAIVYDSVVI